MDLKEKTATLVLSKPLEGKSEFINYYVKESIKKNKIPLFVLTDKTCQEVKQEFLKDKVFFKNLYFVDCYSQQTGNFAKNTENIKYVSGPLALNELSIALLELEREFAKKEIPHTIIFDSLSTLLMYSNAEAIARFLQILIAKIKRFNTNIIFTLEEGMHDQRAVITIEHLMDSIIELKKENNEVLIKRKEKGHTEGWTELDSS
jgi:archaellum biogenesis ATPase FlaH